VVEVRQLRYFVAVAEELHFGRAAERLHVAQPAVSQQVSRLERELGVRLLARSSRRVALTGDGQRLLGEARAALAAVERVRTVAADLAGGRAGTLRVGTSPGVGERLGRAVARMRARVPEIALVLADGSASRHVAALRAGELDIALVRGPVRARDLQAVEVWRDPLQVLLPAAHSAADAEAVAVETLGDLTLRLPDRSTDPAMHDAVLAACRDAGVAPRTGRPVRSLRTPPWRSAPASATPPSSAAATEATHPRSAWHSARSCPGSRCPATCSPRLQRPPRATPC
jgi:DNA-binding transcriptional LysR family regulator